MESSVYIPNSIEGKDGSSVKFTDIHNEFAQSEEGEILKNNVRFARFQPIGMSNGEWVSLLGADSNNLHHLLLSLYLAKNFLKYQSEERPFSKEEAEILCLAALTHDWAEAVVGDTNYEYKSPGTDNEEKFVYRTMLFDKLGDKLDIDVLERVFETAMETRSKLGRAFSAIESVGYTRTSLNAWDVSKKVNGRVSEAMKWLSSNVLGNKTQLLLQQAKIYHPVRMFVQGSRERISEVFQDTTPSMFLRYPERERRSQYTKYIQALQAWGKHDGAS